MPVRFYAGFCGEPTLSALISRTLHIELTPEQQKKRRVSVKQAAELRGISEDSFRRHYGHLIRQETPRRQTVALGDVLSDD
jgi:hypothetical protein